MTTASPRSSHSIVRMGASGQRETIISPRQREELKHQQQERLELLYPVYSGWNGLVTLLFGFSR